jgi:hypothetical protein
MHHFEIGSKVSSLSRYFTCVVSVLVSSSAIAEWTKVSNDVLRESEQYIDQDSVKQSGPMAIYRQVHVLSQGSELLDEGVSSRLSVYEYDCMNIKLRVLEISGFSEAWAKGQKTGLQPASPNSRQWQDLPSHALGQVTFNMLCPSGKDD